MGLVGHLLFTKTKTNVFGLPERIDWLLDHGNKKHTWVKFPMVTIFTVYWFILKKELDLNIATININTTIWV